MSSIFSCQNFAGRRTALPQCQCQCQNPNRKPHLVLQSPPAATLVPGTLTKVSVDAGSRFHQSLLFVPRLGPDPTIQAIQEDRQYRELTAALVDPQLGGVVLSFPDAERWQFHPLPAEPLPVLAQCRARMPPAAARPSAA